MALMAVWLIRFPQGWRAGALEFDRPPAPLPSVGESAAGGREQAKPDGEDALRQFADRSGLSEVRAIVYAEGRAPIAGARVSFQWQQGSPIQRTTGTDGIASVLSDSEGECRIVATHPGYSSAYRLVMAPYPASIGMILHTPSTISGRVETPQGTPSESEFLVVAWPADRIPTPDELRRLRNGERLFPATTSGRGGRFELRGLRPGKKYQLVAASGANLTPAPVSVASGQSDVVLHTRTFYGAAVHVRDVNGDTPMTSPILYSSRVGGATCLAADAEPWPVVLQNPMLSFLPIADGALDFDAPYQLILVYSAGRHEPDIGPVHVRVAPPGYSECSLDIRASRLDRLVVPVVANVKSVSPAWGAIEFRFATSGTQLEHSSSLPPLVGHLRDLSSGLESEFEVVDWRQPIYLGAVPQSSYEFTVSSPAGLQVIPERGVVQLQVGPELCERELSLARMAGVHIRVELAEADSDGCYDGPLQIELIDANGGSSYFDFARHPYALAGIPAGKYSVVGRLPGHGPERVEVDLTFSQSSEIALDFGTK